MASVAHDPAELIEAYFERGWTDGLPVVPPTEKSIAAMLAGAEFRGDEVIGEIVERGVIVSAEKLAINAVLAGCRPEYLPVVIAAVRGLCHRDFAYHGPASSTGGSAMVLIVNGPVAQALGINSGNNAFGQGARANATIGRAVRLEQARRRRVPRRARPSHGRRPQARRPPARRRGAGGRDDLEARVRGSRRCPDRLRRGAGGELVRLPARLGQQVDAQRDHSHR